MGDIDDGSTESANLTEISELSKRISQVLRKRRLALGLEVEDVRRRLSHRIGVEHFRAVELGEESILLDLFIELCAVYELRIDRVVEQATEPDTSLKPADHPAPGQLDDEAD